MRETITNFVVGPFYDLKRFTVGSLTAPPSTRDETTEGLATARAVLVEAGCDLSHCSENNLHTGTTPMPLEQLFDLVAAWQVWPRSAFIACPRTDELGEHWFSYRFYKLLPIVVMKLKTSVKPRYIIYDLISGVGAGGCHAFLFDRTEDGMSVFSILTTFAPTPMFFEGLHDQVNYDIYRKINALSYEQK